jgi:Mg2+/Co2+ transporter CorB
LDDITTGVLFGILVAMLILSAFFSGSETALMALNRYRLRHLVKLKHKGAIKAQQLLNRPDRLLGMILLGNIFVNTVAASVVTIIAIRLYPQYENSVLIADVALILVTLIFSEATPKTFAAVKPETLAFPSAWVYVPMLWVFYPIIEFVNIFVNLLLRMFRVDVTKHSQEAPTGSSHSG